MLSECGDEFMATPKLITVLPISLPSEKTPFLSNPIPYPEYFFWSISGCFVNLFCYYLTLGTNKNMTNNAMLIIIIVQYKTDTHFNNHVKLQ